MNQRGDTLIEVIMSLTILTAVIISSFGLANLTMRVGRDARERTQAQALVQEQIEAVRNLRDSSTWAGFDAAMAGGTPEKHMAKNGLGPGWVVGSSRLTQGIFSVYFTANKTNPATEPEKWEIKVFVEWQRAGSGATHGSYVTTYLVRNDDIRPNSGNSSSPPPPIPPILPVSLYEGESFNPSFGGVGEYDTVDPSASAGRTGKLRWDILQPMYASRTVAPPAFTKVKVTAKGDNYYKSGCSYPDGDPRMTVRVDGVTVISQVRVTSGGYADYYGNLTRLGGSYLVEVWFETDCYGGSASQDRNLNFDKIEFLRL